MKREGEKEWYFGNADKERLGPYSFDEMKAFWVDGTITTKTRCWAQVTAHFVCICMSIYMFDFRSFFFTHANVFFSSGFGWLATIGGNSATKVDYSSLVTGDDDGN